MPVYEKFQKYLEATTTNVKQITFSFDQIIIILCENLPEEAYKESGWWNNEIINAEGYSLTWLDAGWKIAKVNIFQRDVVFIRRGEDFDLPASNFKDKLNNSLEYYRRRWFNRYPDDPEHYVGIETRSSKTFWMVIDEDRPYEMEIRRFGKRCGYIRFVCTGKSIEIKDIFIDKRYRGEGLGSYVMKYFLLLARSNGFEKVEAGVQPEDDFPLEKLMEWYHKFGFRAFPPDSRWMIRQLNK